MTAGSRTRLNGLLILLTVPGHCPARPPHPRTGARGRVPQRRMLGRLAPVPPARQASCSPGPPPWPSPRQAQPPGSITTSRNTPPARPPRLLKLLALRLSRRFYTLSLQPPSRVHGSRREIIATGPEFA